MNGDYNTGNDRGMIGVRWWQCKTTSDQKEQEKIIPQTSWQKYEKMLSQGIMLRETVNEQDMHKKSSFHKHSFNIREMIKKRVK